MTYVLKISKLTCGLLYHGWSKDDLLLTALHPDYLRVHRDIKLTLRYRRGFRPIGSVELRRRR